MPFPHLTYALHPPSQSSQQQHLHDISFLRRKLMNSYTGCKYIGLAFNVLFILRTLDHLHDSGLEAVNVAINQGLMVSSSMIQAIFEIAMYVIVMVCLIMDMIVINTKKLSVANCFWRPGILFFVLTCGDQSIRLLNDSMNSQHFFDLCRKDLSTFTPLPATIIICDLQVQMDCITGFAAFCRDMIASTIYIFAVHYYVDHLVQELKRQHQDTVSMDYVRSRQSDTGTHHIDPVVIHPRTANDGFMTETSTPG